MKVLLSYGVALTFLLNEGNGSPCYFACFFFSIHEGFDTFEALSTSMIFIMELSSLHLAHVFA